MKIYEYKDGMSLEEQKNGAYFERNMLALFLAKYSNWFNDTNKDVSGWYYDTENNWDGWKRVISLLGGVMCFHIPDDFDVGNIPQIEPNWNGHSTIEKWQYAMLICGCDTSDQKPICSICKNEVDGKIENWFCSKCGVGEENKRVIK